MVDRGHLPCVGGERPHLLLCNPDLAREGPFVTLSSASLGPHGHEEPGIVFLPLGDKNQTLELVFVLMNYFQAAVCLENKALQLQGGWRLRENSRRQAGFPGSPQQCAGGLGSPGPAIVGGVVGGTCLSILSCQRGDHTSWFCVPYRHVEGATVNVHEENV